MPNLKRLSLSRSLQRNREALAQDMQLLFEGPGLGLKQLGLETLNLHDFDLDHLFRHLAKGVIYP